MKQNVHHGLTNVTQKLIHVFICSSICFPISSNRSNIDDIDSDFLFFGRSLCTDSLLCLESLLPSAATTESPESSVDIFEPLVKRFSFLLLSYVQESFDEALCPKILVKESKCFHVILLLPVLLFSIRTSRYFFFRFFH